MAETKPEQITPEYAVPNPEATENSIPAPEGLKRDINESVEENGASLDNPAPLKNGIPVYVEPGVAEKQAKAELPAGVDLISSAVGKVLTGKEDIETVSKMPADQLLGNLLEQIDSENGE